MSLVDLCDRRLGTEIRAAVDDDVHLTSHLISTHPHKRKLGYKPENFTGGCLEVDVIFSFPVSIATVSFTATCSNPCQAQIRLSRNIPPAIVPADLRNKDFYLAGTVPLTPSNSTIILTTVSDNTFAKIKQDYRHIMPDSVTPQKLFAQHIAKSCQCLRIRVTTYAAERWLKDLSVIGELGCLNKTYLNRERITRREILSRIRSVGKQQVEGHLLNGPSATSPKPEIVPTVETTPKDPPIDTSDVPSEFLDALTHQILNFPMILPSGNVVDNSTLEKHSREEAKWGREPSDPFTGITFSRDHMPIHHTSLKQRIDEWRTKDRVGCSVGVGGAGIPMSTRILSGNVERINYSAHKKDVMISKRLKRLGKTSRTPSKASSKAEPHSSAAQPTSSTQPIEVIEIIEDDEEGKDSENCDKFDVDQKLRQLLKHDEELELF